MHTLKMRTNRSGKRHHTTAPAPGTARAEAIDIRSGVFRQPAMQTPVLVLNASYEPINICGARRALVLVLKGVARTEEEQGSVLHSHRMRMQIALGHPPARVPQNSPPDPRALAQKHPAPRPQHLPVLPGRAHGSRAHARPRPAALPRRRVHVGKPRRLLPRLQPPQGQPVAA